MNNGRQFGAHPEYGDVVAGQWVDGEPIEPRDFVCWSLWARWTQFQLMRKVIRRESVRAETDLFTVVRPLARLVRHLPPPQKEWSSQRFGDWGFDRYALAVRDMARRHGVTEEFQLKKKMQEQDLLSTWVEYFYFEARWFNFWRRFTRSLEREYQDDFQILIDNRVLRDAETPQDVENFEAKLGESEEKRALEGLQTRNATVALLDAKRAEPATTPEESAELQKLLDEAREARADAEKCHWKTRQRNRLVREFLRSTRQHREEHGNMRCMGRFLRWVRAQIAAIAREVAAAAAAAANESDDGSVTPTPEAPNPRGGDGSEGAGKRKKGPGRRLAHAARRRAGCPDSTDDSSSSSDSGSDASQPASKRRRPGAAAGDDDGGGDGDGDDPKAAARRRLARRLGEVDIVVREDDAFPGAACSITGALGAAYVVVMGRRKRARRKLDKGKGVVYDARLPSEAPSEAETAAAGGGGRAPAFGGFSPLNGPGGFGARFGPGAAAGSGGPDGGGKSKGKQRSVHVASSDDDADDEDATPTPRFPAGTGIAAAAAAAAALRNAGTQAPPSSPPGLGDGFERITYQTSVLGCNREPPATVVEWQRRLYRESLLGLEPAEAGGSGQASGSSSAGGGGVALALARARGSAPHGESGLAPDPGPTSGDIARALMEAMARATPRRANRPQIPRPSGASGSAQAPPMGGVALALAQARGGPSQRSLDDGDSIARALMEVMARAPGPGRPPGHPRRGTPGGDDGRAARPPHAAAAAAAAAGVRVRRAGARGGGDRAAARRRRRRRRRRRPPREEIARRLARDRAARRGRGAGFGPGGGSGGAGGAGDDDDGGGEYGIPAFARPHAAGYDRTIGYGNGEASGTAGRDSGSDDEMGGSHQATPTPENDGGGGRGGPVEGKGKEPVYIVLDDDE